ncbi:SOS response-associated peptidase [Streptomyces sp. HPF1205]|uniref:SOS response-associated peptidase n=1 Tax=Streptomyces sp. HPF1205 TaxID=2873262 RepID=UPI001CED761A|nr:SOS response-associated peptidase [Streptomyces sp. HPF1205]
MCGRYVSTRSPQELAGVFGVDRWDPREDLAPSWNVAPTDEVWSVLERQDRATGEVARQLRPLRWGLVPSWAKDPSVGSRMINARVETVADKPAFRRAFARRRCLLPADGFYEWQSVPGPGGKGRPRKQPYFIRPEDGQLMALAGLYEFWRDPRAGDDHDPGAWLTTCTVITTDAADAAGRIHPRMPLAIAPRHWDAWLDPDRQDAEDLRSLLSPPADGRLDARPVSPAVNDVRNNGPELLEEPPAGTAPAPGAPS